MGKNGEELSPGWGWEKLKKRNAINKAKPDQILNIVTLDYGKGKRSEAGNRWSPEGGTFRGREAARVVIGRMSGGKTSRGKCVRSPGREHYLAGENRGAKSSPKSVRD